MNEYGAMVEWHRQGENQLLREKPLPVPFCTSYIPHVQTWDRILVSSVKGRRLTALVTARLRDLPFVTPSDIQPPTNSPIHHLHHLHPSIHNSLPFPCPASSHSVHIIVSRSKIKLEISTHYNAMLLVYRFVLLYNDVGQFQDAVKLSITMCWVPEQR